MTLRNFAIYIDGNHANGGVVGQRISINAVASKTIKAPAPHTRMRKLSNVVRSERISEAERVDGDVIAEHMSNEALHGRSPSVINKLREASVAPGIEATLASKTAFYRQHILSVSQFTRADLHVLFNTAHDMRTTVERRGTLNLLSGRILGNLFLEPSTRTSCSFESAMLRLGGQVVSINDSSSSVKKGESLEDTVRTVGCYTDVIVTRNPEVGSAAKASKVSKVPVLNAGDGVGEHPTQAFLDVYTIREELGTVNGLTVTIVGDLKNGRTVHSLVKVLALYDVRINYVSPDSLRIPSQLM